MFIHTECPNCSVRIKLAGVLANRKVKCPKCGSTFTATDSNSPSVRAQPPLPDPQRAPAGQQAAPNFPDDFPGDDEPALAPPDVGIDGSSTAHSADSTSSALSSSEPLDGRESTPVTLYDYLTFRRMITPLIIKTLFWIVVVGDGVLWIAAIAIGTRIYFMNKEEWPAEIRGPAEAAALVDIGVSIIAFFVVPVIVRIWFEYLILFFQMNETLADIRSNTQK